MAFSATRVNRSCDGNTYREIWAWNAAGVTTGTFSVGLGTIFHKVSNNDVSEGQGLVTHSGSNVTIASVVSGDTGTIEIVGH